MVGLKVGKNKRNQENQKSSLQEAHNNATRNTQDNSPIAHPKGRQQQQQNHLAPQKLQNTN